jgi:hypothetical protein
MRLITKRSGRATWPVIASPKKLVSGTGAASLDALPRTNGSQPLDPVLDQFETRDDQVV